MLVKNYFGYLYSYFSNLTIDGLELRFCGIQYFEHRMNSTVGYAYRFKKFLETIFYSRFSLQNLCTIFNMFSENIPANSLPNRSMKHRIILT